MARHESNADRRADPDGGARLVGQYAIAVTWADGHDTGYYTYESLRENCRCPACTTARAGQG
ncbi:MAG: gamma-butyrobetaine hydroxylase-like domain-containing protein [Candidatus Limnocylindrales bacterium]